MKQHCIIYLFIISCMYFLPDPIMAQEEQLHEIIIQSSLDTNKVIKQISSNFKRKRAALYACEVLHYRTAYSNNKCIEFNAYQGVNLFPEYNWNIRKRHWDNKANTSLTAPLTVFRSNAFTPNGELLEIHSVTPGDLKHDADYYKIAFNNKLASHGYLFCRAIELYSPLNKRMYNNFRYTILKQYKDSTDNLYMLIGFCNKTGSFPHKTKLQGSGTILYDITRRHPIEITMYNHMDFYSSYIRTDAQYFKGLASEHSITIRYAVRAEKLFPNEIIIKAHWPIVKGNQDGNLYSLLPNPRRNPFKYKIAVTEVFKFSNFKTLSTGQIQSLIQYFPSMNMEFTTYYCAPYIDERWKEIQYEHINFSQIQKDLNVSMTLAEQAEANAFTALEERLLPQVQNREKYLNFSHEFYKLTQKEIYPRIFNKEF